MPHQPTLTEIRITNINTCLTAALTLLNELNDAFGPPFVHLISNTILALISAVQDVKKNKEDCLQLMENIHKVLDCWGPSHRDHPGHRGIHKHFEDSAQIYTFVKAQQDGNKIKQLLRQSEMNALLKGCQDGLNHALEVFQVNTSVVVNTNINEMKKKAASMHTELLELISTLSDGTVSDKSSSVYHGANGSRNRIPPGLLFLVEEVWGRQLSQEQFSTIQIQQPNSEKDILYRTSGTDNHNARCREAGQSLLDSPISVPLKPLSDEAARQTFNEIADHSDDSEEKEKLLRLTDNMPLAVDLIAHLVDYEGLSNVLARWETEKTSVISPSDDRRSSLDASIAVSLASTRVTSEAKELLSLLSILPDGLSDIELVQSNLPIQDILRCKSILLATSLAYSDNGKRLRSLVPIREHIQKFHPPSRHFHSLLGLYEKNWGEQLGNILTRITVNLANLQEVLHRGLYVEYLDLADTIQSQESWFGVVFHYRGITKISSQFSCMDPQGISLCEKINNPVLESHEAEWLAKFYSAVGEYNLYFQLDPSQAIKFLNQALALAKSCADAHQHCSTLNTMAFIHQKIGSYSTAINYAREARRIANVSANLYGEAEALGIEGSCSIFLGSYQNSSISFRMARDILNICGMIGSYLDYSIMTSQAEIHLLKSEYAEARSIHEHTIEDISLDKDGYNYGLSVLNIAQIDSIIGKNKNDVLQNIHKAKPILSRLPAVTILCDMFLADLELRENNTMLAGNLFQKCLHLSWGRESQAVSFCLERLADVSQWNVPEQGTWLWLVVYLGYAQKAKEKLGLHKALLFLGDVFSYNQDDETSYNLFTVALEGFTYMDVHHSQAQCMLRLGDLAQKQGDTLKATELWVAAQPLFERSLQTKDVAGINDKLAAIKDGRQTVLTHLMKLQTLDELFPEFSVSMNGPKITEVETAIGGDAATDGVPVVL
ncbi:hypothetical protein B0H14DRAFT_3713155 [Mycena olivaceomarginata]|nr:hypothetical protein B0H14DRAFT_3713155 [Mycena olivaceomarginata]